jgi:hypothetical protein
MDSNTTDVDNSWTVEQISVASLVVKWMWSVLLINPGLYIEKNEQCFAGNGLRRESICCEQLSNEVLLSQHQCLLLSALEMIAYMSIGLSLDKKLLRPYWYILPLPSL